MRTWTHVTRHAPCAICGHPDWCAVSADGAWAVCRRTATGAAVHRTDRAGADYWLYRLDGPSPMRQRRPVLPAPAGAPCAAPATLDHVYRSLLGMLALAPSHRQALRQRGLPDTEIQRRHYRVGALQVVLQTERLKIAQDLPHAQMLVQELLNFRVTIDPRTAHDSYAAWREGQHDDLVLACALACWWGEHWGPPAAGSLEEVPSGHYQAPRPFRWGAGW